MSFLTVSLVVVLLVAMTNEFQMPKQFGFIGHVLLRKGNNQRTGILLNVLKK